MPRATNKLTHASLKKTAPGYYADGNGLYLQITQGKDGEPRRSWLCRITVKGVRRELGLGRVQDLPLAEARERCAEYRRMAATGIDPVELAETQEKAKAAEEAERKAKAMTFKQAAEAYISAHRTTWAVKHAAQWPSTLSRYVYPLFGDVAVGVVDRGMVLRALEAIWHTRTDTANRVRQRIEKVLDWATARGLREGENPARWRGGLQNALPAKSKLAKVQHHPAMDFREAPAFMRDLAERTGAGADCLRFIILTACRFGEAAGATWREIDLDAGVWNIAADRMKGGRPHRVALSAPAVALLTARAKAHGREPSGLVFPNDLSGKRLSDMAVSAVLRRMNLAVTTHGFRSTFRTWAGERTNFPRELAEAALAHVVGDAVERAYARSDLFDRRRKLMEAWADYLAKPAAQAGANVTNLGARRAGMTEGN
jgi:integrase